MKNQIILLGTLLLLVAGCSDDYDDGTKTKARKSVESFLMNNYEDIKSVEFTNVYQSEMGGLNVDGTINGGEAEFSAGIENDFSVGSIGLGEGFPEIKKACLVETCDY
ncbi:MULTISPECIES: DUF1433 domain-containing protein [Bacillaceae]|uniref:DUF1433 domain-containing protein n=1 Tax=Bacillales TaxID=1385 RepID=UPI001883914F|nr:MULTISPECIES: DUF1433 domain-containing protein [Bacillaceae]MBF0707684.1 DUF1433 domain-containing protein [Pseudalkalibacillus hwajinpoensis]MDO6654543.1 DUF1433 domain-containing protein [Anaerobacillus sp. 1_MG-2023]